MSFPFFGRGIDIDPVLDDYVVPFEDGPVEGRDRKHEQKRASPVREK